MIECEVFILTLMKETKKATKVRHFHVFVSVRQAYAVLGPLC